MGEAFTAMIKDRTRLLLTLQCFAACEDVDVREAIRAKWRDLVRLAESVSGEGPEVVSHFFASGMLLTVMTAMRLFEDPTDWGDRLADGCVSWLRAPEQ